MTTPTEDRLRAALRAGGPDLDLERAWADVQRQVTGRRRGLPGRMLLAAAAAIVVLAVLGASVLLRDDDRVRVDVGPVEDPTTTMPAETTTTSTTTATTLPASTDPFEGVPTEGPTGSVWPYWTFEQIDAQPDVYRDPAATALAFAREYLGMPDPVVADTLTEGFSVSVTVVPRPGAPMRTHLWLHPFGGEGGPYAVYHADTGNIVPDRESLTEPVGRTIPFRGESTAFEGNLTIEVREDGGRLLGTTFATGGANGQFGPFAGELTIDEPTTEGGAIIFATESAEDGTRQEAAVVRITFADNVVRG